MSDPSKPDSIHTSCRSESSNKSLVVLDKDPSSSQNNWPIENNLDHHWHCLLLIHPPGIKGQNIAAQDTIILLSAGQSILCDATTNRNCKSWLFIQHHGMRWQMPPGGRPCQARNSCWAQYTVLQLEAAWWDWPSRVDLETCSIGFGSFTYFLCLTLLFSSKNTGCKHYQLTHLVLIWNNCKKYHFSGGDP